MFIGQLKVSRNGRSYTYHRLLESVRTDKGPRQRLVLSLGTLDLPKSEWPRLAERIEDLLNHQELIPFGSCDLDQLAAPFAERIRHKQQRRRAQQEGQGPAKEVFPERSGSEHIRELGPEYVAHVFWGAPALRPVVAALRVLATAVSAGRDPGGGQTVSTAQ